MDCLKLNDNSYGLIDNGVLTGNANSHTLQCQFTHLAMPIRTLCNANSHTFDILINKDFWRSDAIFFTRIFSVDSIYSIESTVDGGAVGF